MPMARSSVLLASVQWVSETRLAVRNSIYNACCLGIGAGTYGAIDEKKALETLTCAADLGVTFWDTSDAYNTSTSFSCVRAVRYYPALAYFKNWFTGQEVIGKWFAATGRRKEIFLATKFGAVDTSKPEGSMERWTQNSKPSYIRGQIAESLKALQTDYIDLYYQHRVDAEVPTEST